MHINVDDRRRRLALGFAFRGLRLLDKGRGEDLYRLGNLARLLTRGSVACGGGSVRVFAVVDGIGMPVAVEGGGNAAYGVVPLLVRMRRA